MLEATAAVMKRSMRTSVCRELSYSYRRDLLGSLWSKPVVTFDLALGETCYWKLEF